MTSPIRLASCAVLTVVLAPIACGSPPDVRTPKPETVLGAAEAEAVWTKAQHVFESRCVVCHGCYDAPCQLKLGTYEGIERGGTERQVYDGSRLIAAEPTRLGIDAHNRFDWRKKDFHPALPEGKETDPRASLLLRMLELKRKHPLASGTDVAKDFTLDLSRKQVCTDAKHFDAYAKEHPGWGMPYALPGVTAEDEKAIVDWVRAGAPHSGPAEHSDAVGRGIADWETFLNDGSPKGQLVGRYIYEHLFLASIRFEGAADGEDGARGSETPLYRLVRSRTESGRPIVEVATRRPFEDPKSARVYYRFERRIERALDKTHMPYPLSPRRLERYRALFFEAPYEVSRLPGYDAETASNPFRAFHAIPVSSRYRFMLEEAQFTLMGFIKGPVCRGQIALNVIEDRFWITFVDPEVAWQKDEADFLADVKEDLDMPAEAGSNALPTFWMNYEAAHARYMAKKAELFERVTKGGRGFTPSAIWDGDGKNPNAALTVFRHFDSATVVNESNSRSR